MPLSDFLNPGEFNADQVEKEIAAGGLIPIGRYHAALVKAEEKPAGGYPKTELEFEILSGQFAGRKVRRDLFHNGDDAEKDKRAKNELIHFSVKLGVMTKLPDGHGGNTYAYVQGMTDFVDAIQTECVLEIHHEKWDRKDPNSQLTARVRMFGIHKLTDKEGVECLNKLGLAPPEAPPTPAPAAGAGDARSRIQTQQGGNAANQGATKPATAAAQPVAGGAQPRKRFDTSKL